MKIGEGTRSAEGATGRPPAEKQRHILFALFLLAALSPFWSSLRALAKLGLEQDYCSQVLVVPFVTLLLIYWQRKRVFRELHSALIIGGVILSAGLLIDGFALHYGTLLGPYDSISAVTLGLVLLCIAGFVAIYGLPSFRAAAFPLGFLFLTVPIPSPLLNRSIFYLQSGSTAIAQGLFWLFGVPTFRRGFFLSVPGLTIHVAQECSSIRSSIVLVITCLLAGYLFLLSPWKRAVLVLLAIPLSVLKNGVRIVTLVLLSLHVDPAFMTGHLHRDGGILFYLLALLILFPIFRWLEKSEKRRYKEPPREPGKSARNTAVVD
jgi:exosortase